MSPFMGSQDAIICHEFQETVAQYLIRHRSFLDVLSKLQESTARTQRAVAKAITLCGCLEAEASKPEIPPDVGFSELLALMDTHLRGELCETCRDVVETEIGHALFYLTALCNLLGLDLSTIMQKQLDRIETLGPFYLA
jgi:hypothetical protein